MKNDLKIKALISSTLLGASFLSADVIITEIADGTITASEQQPKFVEITNVGTEPYTFPEGSGLINQNNANTDLEVDWELSGITLQPGQSWVVNSLTPGDADLFNPRQFFTIFGFDADEYADVAFGNGDDRYILTDGTNYLDIYGENAVDGTGLEWEYTDGYAYRKPQITTGSGLVFEPGEWVFGGVDSLEAATEAEQIALAKAVLTPGFYDSGIEPNTWAGYAVDEFGNVDTVQWMGFLNVAGGDWVWTYSLSKYIYMPEGFVSASGAWTYIPGN